MGMTGDGKEWEELGGEREELTTKTFFSVDADVG
jgi:hypothetical protein